MEFKQNFDENLREVYDEPDKVRAHLDKILAELDVQNSNEKFDSYSVMGVHWRILYELKDSEKCFLQAFALLDETSFDPETRLRKETILKIRYAHLLQWRERFEESTKLFLEMVEICQQSLPDYLDFAYQHLGKNYFDMKEYQEAQESFEKALEIRLKKGNQELIESTEMAIKRNRELMSQS